jgi:hypothetical protein
MKLWTALLLTVTVMFILTGGHVEHERPVIRHSCSSKPQNVSTPLSTTSGKRGTSTAESVTSW